MNISPALLSASAASESLQTVMILSLFSKPDLFIFSELDIFLGHWILLHRLESQIGISGPIYQIDITLYV